MAGRFFRRRGRRVGRRPTNKRRLKRRIRSMRSNPKTQPIKSFTRMFKFTISASGGRGDYYSLSNLNNYQEFTNLFDFYRIKAMKLKFVPNYSTNTVYHDGSSTNYQLIPRLAICRDLNDATAPANEAEVLEYPGAKIHRLNKIFTYYTPVAAQNEIYNNGITTAYAQVPKGTWLDTQYPGVFHFGTKMYITGSWPNFLTVDVYVKYYMQFKNPR